MLKIPPEPEGFFLPSCPVKKYLCKKSLFQAMNNTYKDLVEQTFTFPQEDFMLKNDLLQFNGLDVMALVKKYGTPMKLTYLPKIGMQIARAKKMFAHAMKKHKYEGSYNYCY